MKTITVLSIVLALVLIMAPLLVAAPVHALGETDDVSIVGVAASQSVVGSGYSMSVNVTAADVGNFTETFNVTAYANTTIITSQNITLPAGNSTTLTFIWNTTGFALGYYVISAYAWPVPNETNTADNNFTDSVVTVTIPGDINGDFKVNLADLVLLASAYNSKPGDPNWNPNADLAPPYGMISLTDLLTMAIHYGQHYP